MARSDVKKGREAKKPKQEGGKKKSSSAYSLRQNESTTMPLKIRGK